MAGQVKHTKIFRDIVPDVAFMKLLARLPFQNTDCLIGAVAGAFRENGIDLIDSTSLFGPLLAEFAVTFQPSDYVALMVFAFASLASLAYLGPGVVLLVRRDWHVVGWLLCALGLVIGVNFASELGVAATRDGDAWLVWVLDVCEGALWFVLMAALLVVSPDALGSRTARRAPTGRPLLVAGAPAAALQAFVTDVGVADGHGAVLPSPLPIGAAIAAARRRAVLLCFAGPLLPTAGFLTAAL